MSYSTPSLVTDELLEPYVKVLAYLNRINDIYWAARFSTGKKKFNRP